MPHLARLESKFRKVINVTQVSRLKSTHFPQGLSCSVYMITFQLRVEIYDCHTRRLCIRIRLRIRLHATRKLIIHSVILWYSWHTVEVGVMSENKDYVSAIFRVEDKRGRKIRLGWHRASPQTPGGSFDCLGLVEQWRGE